MKKKMQTLASEFLNAEETIFFDGKGDKKLSDDFHKFIHKATRNKDKNKARKSSKKKHAVKRK